MNEMMQLLLLVLKQGNVVQSKNGAKRNRVKS